MDKRIHYPNLDRPSVIMPTILRACLRRPRGYSYLEKKTGSSRGSLHVLCNRLRAKGLLKPINPGTVDVKYQTTKKGGAAWQ